MNRHAILVTGCALLWLAGCGGVKVYPVTGTVTLDGKTTSGLLVAFAPDGVGVTGTGTTDAEGKYTITSIEGAGIPEGSYRIAITKVTEVESSPEEEEAYASSDSAAYERLSAGDPDQYRDAAQAQIVIPSRYNAQTTLKETVAAVDSNVFNFDLTSK